MKLHVSHFSTYRYDQSVAFSPHILYLRPREDGYQRIDNYQLKVSPAGKTITVRDPHDNILQWVHLWESSEVLSFHNEFTVTTTNDNPFDFILKPYAVPFPFAYEPVFDFALGPYLAPPFPDTQTALLAWLDEHFPNRPVETVPFLSELNRIIYERIAYKRRDEHGIQPSNETLRIGSGSCRDFAVLLIEICRTLGLAARFISGYLFAPPEDSHRSFGAMHAWVEVYLPGAGWKAMDPTHGIFCDDAFVAVAHSAQAESVNPIQGSYYNASPVRSRLETSVLVERID